MKKLYKYLILTLIVVSLVGCKDDFLDRPPLDEFTDASGKAWTTEDNLRLYVNQWYPSFFTGYGVKFDVDSAALLDYKSSDDVVRLGNQTTFTRAVPTDKIWNMRNIREVNLMLERMEERMTDILTPEAYAHWSGIARFFRAFRYFHLVTNFGDVPYYDHVVSDTDLDDLYKPRTPRNEVMNAVYDDLKFAFENVRLDDGNQQVNRYIVAGFISRMALHEGSWQKYYYHNNEQAKKFFEFAIDAANFVITSGKYDINTDYRSLFTSLDLNQNKEMVMYRAYDGSVGVTHSVASNSNFASSTNDGPTTDLIKSYIAVDGKVYSESGIADAEKFDLANLIKTRDSRFEATFYGVPDAMNRGSLVYINKFLPRDVEALVKNGGTMPSDFTGDKNHTDAPVLRYAEVLLNWIEAKAELELIGGPAVVQDDIKKSINKIRHRPIAPQAKAKGVVETADLKLDELPDDPDRDFSVPRLLWEIRRERRMELVFEYSRLADLKRWSKLNYMDTDENKDLLSGGWVMSGQVPDPVKVPGKLAVVDLDDNMTVFNGANILAMNGFYRNTTNTGRLPFLNQPNINPYLEPIGRLQIDQYAARGYELKQTEGWPQN